MVGTFKDGDVAVLKSDGRIKVTIYSVSGTDYAKCVWYNGHTGAIEYITIPQEALLKS
jgi:uncharacterized protein YodC (DUF2158 family)